MAVKIIGLIIGVLILAFGLYYRTKEKADAESVRIYTIIGGVVAIVCALFLFL